ncbi:MAG: hypothetical protein KJ077_08255 [Anaerolineae bacterium]|nr:hypothetical protein [Anaerolineae bacterium]
MNQSAFERIEGLVKRPASMPYDGIVAEVFPDQVTVRKTANNQIMQRVVIADHIDKSKLKKGVPVRLGEHLGQPIVLAIFPQLEGDINYAGKGSVVPAPPTVTVAGTAAGWLVTWTAVPGADRYRVYRNDDPDETTPDDLDYVTGTTLLVPYESPYLYFAVRACSGLNESELSAWVTDAVGPLTPNTFVALNHIGGHQLTIAPTDVSRTHSGLRYFEIEQANDDSGTGAVSLGYFYYPDQFPALQTFGVGTVKYYRIRAIDWAGNMSDWTAWDVATSGQSEVQEPFDGYGGSTVVPLESLWWLYLDQLDSTAAWAETGGHTLSASSPLIEGPAALKVTAVGGSEFSDTLYKVYSPVLDLSTEERFTDNDYVMMAIYALAGALSGGPVTVNLSFVDKTAAPRTLFQSPGFDLSAGWNYIKFKKDDFTAIDDEVTPATPNWNHITQIEIGIESSNVLSAPNNYFTVDDLRIVKADPDDATTYNDTGKGWDRAASTGTDFGEWHIYAGNRSGEPARPFTYGQVKAAASPAAWYLSHRPLETIQIPTGTIQTGIYLKGADGKAGLAFFIKDVDADSWDMYAVEADSTGDTIKLVKWVAGTRTDIASASFTFASGQILWLAADFRDYDADGGRIKVYASFSDGNLIQAANMVISAQDTAVGSGGSVGLLSYQANVRFVDFRAGSPAHAETADVAFALNGPILAGETRRVHYNRDASEFQWSDDGATFTPVYGVWQTWTPTVVQSGSVTVTVTYARYTVIGKTVLTQVRLAVTGSGTAGNEVRIQGIPAAIAPNRVDGSTAVAVCGTAVVYDNGTAFYQGALVAVGANDLRIICHGEGNRLGADPNFGLASGDVISFQGLWERA